MKNLTYILFGLIFSSCFSLIEPDDQAKYIESKSNFDSTLVQHFPRILPNEYYELEYGGAIHQSLMPSQYLYVRTRFRLQKRYEKQKDLIENQSIFSISSNDTCIIKVFAGYAIETKDNIDSLAKLNNSCANGYPVPTLCIPDYNYLNDNPNTIYVFKADNKDLINITDRPSFAYLPINWKTGYSYGCAVNDKYLMIDYWLIIW